MSDERRTREGSNVGAATSAKVDPTAAEDSESTAARPSGKRSSRRSRGKEVAATAATTTEAAPRKSETKKAAKAKRTRKENPFKRLFRFLREVVAELKKVIWPNRKQMVTYTSVVLVFVIFMVAFISGLDVAFIKGVTWLFG